MTAELPLRGPDQAARDVIRNQLDESLLVEAAAGTGKTTELVHRLVALLRDGRAEPDGIVAVTFTRKAAGELKLRLRQELDRARITTEVPEERRRLGEAVAHLEEAHVGTIHSFCAELLRERPVEAGIDPAFEELAEEDSPAFFERAFRPWVESRLDSLSPVFRRLLSRCGVLEWRNESPLDQIRQAAVKFLEWRDFRRAWQRRPFDREQEIDRLVKEVRSFAALLEACPNPRDDLINVSRSISDLATWVKRAEQERPRDYDHLEASLIQLGAKLKREKPTSRGPNLFAPGFPREAVLERRSEFLAQLETFSIRSGADLAAQLQPEFHSLVDAFESLKRRCGRLDFVDLLVKSRDLLVENQEIRAHFQAAFSHIFVDEFQDTDPLQGEILLLLAGDDPKVSDWRKVSPYSGKLFLVGDPKQSIYRFRRADVLLYHQIRERLRSHGVRCLELTRSFRSRRPIQLAVNAAFEPVMQADPESGQPAYMHLDEVRPESPDQPSVIALPVPHPYGKRMVANYAIDESLPVAAAAFVEWLLEESGWKVEDPVDRGSLVPIGPGHIAFLFRRFVSWNSDITRAYARELEIRGIPHVLVGSRSFHDREEVEMLRTALTAVEWPDDELAVYATLRGSLFSISDRTLFLFRQTTGSLRPFRKWGEEIEEEFQPILESLRLIARLHRSRNHRPISDTIAELLSFTRAHAGLALRPAGHQVLANVQRVCDLARSFEARGGTSFRAFVDFLQDQVDRRSAESTVLEEGTDGVRLMTVHGAKGLEFPVVLLADMTCKLTAFQPDKFVDVETGLAAFSVLGCRPWDLIDQQAVEEARDQAEGIRLAYVAATRARDLLVVPAVGDEERDGWLGVLNPALYPPAERRRVAVVPAPGCPEFGTASVLSRPLYYDGSTESSVRPGVHRPRAGEHRVVWFDPALLKLDVQANYGVRQQEILSPDDDALKRQLELYDTWQSRLRETHEIGATRAFQRKTVTEDLVGVPPPERFPVRVERVRRTDRVPGGRRFGTLVHTVLRDVALDGDDSAIRRLAGLHGRMLDSSSREVDEAVSSVRDVLRHPLLESARSSSETRREVPFLLALDDYTLVEGAIDLAFREGERWVVVDFKTDSDGTDRLTSYQVQVEWYVYGLHRLTGQEAEGWLLWI